MSAKESPGTLGEMLGSGQEKVTMENLPKILGLKMPEIPMNEVGKIRLIHALQQRFGANFRQMPGVNELLDGFNKDLKINNTIKENKRGS